MDQIWILVAASITFFGIVLLVRRRGPLAPHDVYERTRRAAARGHEVEEAAASALMQAGYTVLERHPEARYTLTIEQAGIPSSKQQIIVTLSEGEQFALVIGNPTEDSRGGRAWFVARGMISPKPELDPQVFVISDSQLDTLKAGFGR